MKIFQGKKMKNGSKKYLTRLLALFCALATANPTQVYELVSEEDLRSLRFPSGDFLEKEYCL